MVIKKDDTKHVVTLEKENVYREETSFLSDSNVHRITKKDEISSTSLQLGDNKESLDINHKDQLQNFTNNDERKGKVNEQQS